MCELFVTILCCNCEETSCFKQSHQKIWHAVDSQTIREFPLPRHEARLECVHLTFTIGTSHVCSYFLIGHLDSTLGEGDNAVHKGRGQDIFQVILFNAAQDITHMIKTNFITSKVHCAAPPVFQLEPLGTAGCTKATYKIVLFLMTLVLFLIGAVYGIFNILAKRNLEFTGYDVNSSVSRSQAA